MERKNQIYKQVMFLAIPMMIQNGLTNAVGLVDNIMVGSQGTESMTAVSIAVQLIFVFNLAIFGGLSGPGIYGAQYYGKGNMEGVRDVFRLKIWICTVCLIAGLLVFLKLDSQIISLYLHGSDEGIDSGLTMLYGRQYLHIMCWQMLPFVVTQIYSGSLRETGASMKPMIAGLCSVVVDIVFNYLLIYGKFGFPHMGVRGAAIATVLARYVEMIVIVVWSHSRSREHVFLQGVYTKLWLSGEMAWAIVKKTIPMFFNEFLWAGGLAVLTQCYSIRGLMIVAGLNISNALCNLLNVVFVTMGTAVGIIIGQMLGAGEFEKAKKDSIRLMRFNGIVCVLLTLILILLSGSFPTLYDTSEEVRMLGRDFIRITALFFPVQGILNSLYFTLRSGGKTVITFLFDSVFSWTVSVPLAFVLCSFSDLPILGIYTIIQAADLIKVVIGYILVKKGVWITNLVSNAG